MEKSTDTIHILVDVDMTDASKTVIITVLELSWTFCVSHKQIKKIFQIYPFIFTLEIKKKKIRMHS